MYVGGTCSSIQYGQFQHEKKKMESIAQIELKFF